MIADLRLLKPRYLNVTIAEGGIVGGVLSLVCQRIFNHSPKSLHIILNMKTILINDLQ
jgi:hypothetical protein